jgi:hypothetical protein
LDVFCAVFPFFAFFFKYWPDCPFPIYLITETKTFADKRVRMINLGTDFGWANNMIKALDTIPEKSFIYFLEDVFIMEKVDTARIVRLLELMRKDNVSCLRLSPTPGPDATYGTSKELGIIDQNAPYRVSTMTAIWDKAAFKRLLKPGENAWQMELDGTKRAHGMKELFLSVWPKNTAIHIFITAIKRGRWQYDAIKLCEREGVPVVTKRAKEGYVEYLTRKASYVPVIGGFFRQGRRRYYASRTKK